MRCTGCAQADVITIRMRVGAEEIVFQRCSACEVNVWQAGDGVIPLERVLELARTSR